MRNYENFTVWKTARDLAVELHAATNELDESIKHDLFNDIRRESVAVMSNIAIGSINKNPVFINYLTKATGHVYACRSKVELAIQLEWLHEDVGRELDEKLRQLSYMIYGLQRSLKERVA